MSPAGRWFWFFAPLVVIYVLVGALIAALAGGNELAGVIGGLVAAIGYLAYWRLRWRGERRGELRRRDESERWRRELDERYPGLASRDREEDGD
ncbi:MAG TPA: hypothetical protein VLK53_12310 [Gaiellaceae bacterium]|nr:hypothetical protein [Gaiellaceae bacterium]